MLNKERERERLRKHVQTEVANIYLIIQIYRLKRAQLTITKAVENYDAYEFSGLSLLYRHFLVTATSRRRERGGGEARKRQATIQQKGLFIDKEMRRRRKG